MEMAKRLMPTLTAKGRCERCRIGTYDEENMKVLPTICVVSKGENEQEGDHTYSLTREGKGTIDTMKENGHKN